jgi:hypothetical protein
MHWHGIAIAWHARSLRETWLGGVDPPTTPFAKPQGRATRPCSEPQTRKVCHLLACRIANHDEPVRRALNHHLAAREQAVEASATSPPHRCPAPALLARMPREQPIAISRPRLATRRVRDPGSGTLQSGAPARRTRRYRPRAPPGRRGVLPVRTGLTPARKPPILVLEARPRGDSLGWLRRRCLFFCAYVAPYGLGT